MLHFFRQLRQRLLTESRFSKYLLYAVGEILLVVIGILIALQVNNWNEERNKSNKENKIVSFIYVELHDNRIYHEIRERELQSRLELGKSLLNLTGPEAHVDFNDSILKMIHDYEYVSLYAPLTAKFNQLISSDDLNLISNDSLKHLFNQYNSILNLAEQLSKILIANSDKLTEYIDHNGLTRDVILSKGDSIEVPTNLLARSWEKKLQDVQFSSFHTSMDYIFQDAEFESIISRRLRELVYNLGRISTVNDQIDLLINFIDMHYNFE